MNQGHGVQQVAQVDKGPAEWDIGYGGRERDREGRRKTVEVDGREGNKNSRIWNGGD